MQVVRLEMPDGIGPWRTDFCWSGLWDVMKNTYDKHCTYNVNGMPTPCRDGILDMGDKEICAYKSLEDMETWVDLKELALAIRECEMKVLLITVENIKVGHHQIVFDRRDIIEQIDISDRYGKPNKNEKVKDNVSKYDYSVVPIIMPEEEC